MNLKLAIQERKIQLKEKKEVKKISLTFKS
jgi:hypothetical protein